MVLGFPVLYQSDQHGKIRNFKGPFNRSPNCAEIVAANLAEETVAYD
jgi:hypothetical protein